MRIWSLHPKYLDAKGLVALWRETLLAKNVLEGKTKGYKNHPQLERFKKTEDPVRYINQYLASVYEEAVERGYNFDRSKFKASGISSQINVTSGQMRYEFDHLLRKLKVRDENKYFDLLLVENISPHPLFRVTNGDVESWEII